MQHNERQRPQHLRLQLEGLSESQCTVVRVPAVKRGSLQSKQQQQQPKQVIKVPSTAAVPDDRLVFASIAAALKYFKAVAAGAAECEYTALAAPPVIIPDHVSATPPSPGDAAALTSEAPKETTGSRQSTVAIPTPEKQQEDQQQHSKTVAVTAAAIAGRPQRKRKPPAADADYTDVDEALEQLELVEAATPAETAAVGNQPAAVGGTVSDGAVVQAGVALAVAEVDHRVGEQPL